MALKINGKLVEATEVAFDGCHKFYLVRTPEERALLEPKGWEDKDFFKLSQLPVLWQLSCALKFIHNADLEGDVVPQDDSYDATIEWEND